jgi:hypothetical protein
VIEAMTPSVINEVCALLDIENRDIEAITFTVEGVRITRFPVESDGKKSFERLARGEREITLIPADWAGASASV